MRYRKFIVWTMQRTGGTTFSSLLGGMHDDPMVHEPFNGPNARGRFSASVNAVKNGLPAPEIECFNYKHCYERCGDSFNVSIASRLRDAEYFMLFLGRRDEVSRLESLALADLTGAFGLKKALDVYPKVKSGEIALPPIDIQKYVNHFRVCRARTRSVVRMLSDLGSPVLYYEDIYNGTPREIENNFLELRTAMLDYGVPMNNIEAFDAMKSSYIKDRNQDSHSIASFVPNIDEFRFELCRELQSK